MVEVPLTARLVLSLEDHLKVQIFSARFCDTNPAYANYFATTSRNTVAVHCLIDGESRTSVDLVQSFYDNDADEVYYCCTWASTGSNTPVLVVGGTQGSIKGLSLSNPFELTSLLMGHGNSVYDLRTHPIDDGLILSASADESIRLWNLRTSVCIAVFAGSGGHRHSVIALDFHSLGNTFVSSGMDTSIKIWNLESPEMREAIRLSDTAPRQGLGAQESNFRTLAQQSPLFSTNLVHCNYVDSVKWVGDCLLTKATDEPIALWAPDSTRCVNATIILRRFAMPSSKMWFSQMDVFAPFDWFVVGDDNGKVFIHSISKPDKDAGGNDQPTVVAAAAAAAGAGAGVDDEGVSIVDLLNPAPKKPVLTLSSSLKTTRCVSFHVGGKFIISSNEGGELHVWKVSP